MSSDGTKVTTDPQTLNNPKNENPGMVTSDSLGAQSIQEGGSFAANSDARGPMKQPSSSTTTNTADVSNADRLDPAPDAEARQASNAWKENEQMNAGAGLGSTSGSAAASTPGGAGTFASSGNAAAASGAQSHPAPTQGDKPKPKGQNITEGGFEGNEPNASFNTDIGGKDDPGRAALGGLQEGNVPVAGGAGPKQGQVSNDGQYDVLKDASA